MSVASCTFSSHVLTSSTPVPFLRASGTIELNINDCVIKDITYSLTSSLGYISLTDSALLRLYHTSVSGILYQSNTPFITAVTSSQSDLLNLIIESSSFSGVVPVDYESSGSCILITMGNEGGSGGRVVINGTAYDRTVFRNLNGGGVNGGAVSATFQNAESEEAEEVIGKMTLSITYTLFDNCLSYDAYGSCVFIQVPAPFTASTLMILLNHVEFDYDDDAGSPFDNVKEGMYLFIALYDPFDCLGQVDFDDFIPDMKTEDYYTDTRYACVLLKSFFIFFYVLNKQKDSYFFFF
jgi:hypothetical protein